MAENTSMTGNSGLGLKAVPGPQGLKVATSVFTAPPDEKIAAVDAYDVQSPGVINNAVEDTGGGSGGLFDSVKSAIAGAVGNLGGIGDMKTKSLDLLKSVKSGTSLLKQVTSVASRAQSAMNQISKGGLMGSIGGLASLGSMGGVSGAFQLASQARGVVSGIQQGGVTGLLRAGSSALGGVGGSLSQLAGNMGAIERLTSRNGLASGGLSGILSTVDSAASIASSTIGSLDKVSQIDFSAGYDAVMKNGSISGKSLSQSTLGRVYTAVGDLTGNTDNKATASIAGIASGLVTLGSSHGDNSIYSLLSSKGMSSDAAFMTGTAISGIAASSGNLSLLADVSSVGIGSQAIASNPNALRATIMNLTPDISSMTKPLASVYDQMETVASATGQAWNKATRQGGTILDASACTANDYAIDVLAAKSAQDNFKSERLTEASAGKAEMTDSQYLYAAAVTPNAREIKVGDKDYDISWTKAKPMTADLW